MTNLFLHRFTPTDHSVALHRHADSTLPGGRRHGNNPQLLSRKGLVEVNLGKGFWPKVFDIGFLWNKRKKILTISGKLMVDGVLCLAAGLYQYRMVSSKTKPRAVSRMRFPIPNMDDLKKQLDF